MRRSKRPALDQNACYPNKKDDRGPGLPFSARHERALSSPTSTSARTPAPSQAYHSTQRTPPSSLKLPPAAPTLGARPHSRLPSHLRSVSQEGAVNGHFKQPETRPISQEKLVDDLEKIYAGIVKLEKKCVETCHQQSQTANKLSHEQWQALIVLHRTLLHEYHDFFLACQHPTASPALRLLPTKHAMPARMCRHGIHSFLELLRDRLPFSLEHMLRFVYLAYQMIGLLMESVPAFYETWIECLGDLGRYRLAIEESDMQVREHWADIARMWYNRAADHSPTTGRIQHHLAGLARQNIVRQLFFYSKALISDIPFVNTRISIMCLFSPFLDNYETTSQKYLKVETSLVTAAGILFTHGFIHDYRSHISRFVSELDGTINRTGSNFKTQGAEMASCLIAMILDFGADENYLWKALCASSEKSRQTPTERQSDPQSGKHPSENPMVKTQLHRKFWEQDGPINAQDFTQAAPPLGNRSGVKFSSSDEVTSYVLPIWLQCTSIVASKAGDRNVLPFLHFTLAFIWSQSYVPEALICLEKYIPWNELALSLNSMSKSGVADKEVESPEFPQPQSGTGRQLPEDFLMRGFKWSQHYYPPQFFDGQVTDEDERLLELPSHAAPRVTRCLWVALRLAKLNRYITYDFQKQWFSVLPLPVVCRQPDVMDED
ncbi:hypothetical protein PV08_12097 [Exophiala spinifera]|uniref:DNA/RNA-binding domain-containing protein n=1 Tax=Exophiala spinifera TaxID=91928 RepID=A0A0D2ASG6_9EURO|nr:uncharacterized protein PV08_12097 [Exophiala spinifera]KIW09653.1 hypothetical protein PV08_12097 [Exophiala spinifera]